MKNYIKRLNLPKSLSQYDFFGDTAEEFFQTYKQPNHNIIFKKLGFYYNRKTKDCWYEAEIFGQWYAFSETPQTFDYELSVLNHIRLTAKEIKSIKIVLDYLDDKKLRKLLYTDQEVKILYYIRLDGYKMKKRFRQRLKEFLEKRN